MDNSSLAHTKWNCKYHMVFVPNFQRKVIYGKIKADIGVILRKLCDHKGVYPHPFTGGPDFLNNSDEHLFCVIIKF